MAITQDAFWSATDFINLKARVKQEMTDRSGNGSLTTYAGTAYDYTVIPASGGFLLEEHYDKIRDLLAMINPSGLPPQKAVGDLITELATLEAKLTTFQAQPKNATSNNDCSSLCTGTCISICIGSCTGSCSACANGCSTCTSCVGGCTGSCSTCAVGCSTCTSCTGGCQGGCSTCAVGCSTCTSCTGGCGGTCWRSCSMSCADNCTTNTNSHT